MVVLVPLAGTARVAAAGAEPGGYLGGASAREVSDPLWREVTVA